MARKKAQAFRTITEVSDWLDTPSHVLRFWESKFPQIKPVKRAGGRRYYRPEDLKLIGGIKVLLHDKGTTIAAVKEMIKSEGEPSVEAHSPEPTFPEKGRRKLRKAAQKAASEAKQETQEIVVKTSVVEKTDVLQLDEMVVPESQQPVAEAPVPVVKRRRDPIVVQSATHTIVGKSTPSASSGPMYTTTGVSESETRSTTTSKQSIDAAQIEKERENNARDFISNAISRVHDTHEDDGETTVLNNLKTRTQIADSQILNIEDLYFQLQRIRNRMKRRLDAM